MAIGIEGILKGFSPSVPKEKVDRESQLSSLLGIMAHHIPREDFSQERLEKMGEHEDMRLYTFGRLYHLIRSTYVEPDFAKLMLLNNMFSIPNKMRRHFNSVVIGSTSEMFKMPKEEVMFDLMARLLYNPTHFYLLMQPVMHTHQIEKYGEFMTVEEARKANLGDIEPIKKAQQRLLSDLIDRNEGYLGLVRDLPYDFMVSRKFRDIVQSFFGDKEKDQGLITATAFSKYHFSLLAHHVGHFLRPNIGKVEMVYASRTMRSIDGLMKRGYHYPDRTADELVHDLMMHGEMHSSLAGFLVSSAAASAERCAQLDSELGPLRLQASESKAVKDQYAAAEQRITELETALKAASPADSRQLHDLQRRYDAANARVTTIERRLSDSEKSLAYERGKKSEYESRISHLTGELAKASTTVCELETALDDFKQQVLIKNESPKYHVQLDPLSAHKQYNGMAAAYRRAMDVLSRDLFFGEVLRSINSANIYRNLKKKYPQYDTFLKLRTQNHTRVIYAVVEQQAVILDAMTHQEYDWLCKP